jgi:hypothetical protein
MAASRQRGLHPLVLRARIVVNYLLLANFAGRAPQNPYFGWDQRIIALAKPFYA